MRQAQRKRPLWRAPEMRVTRPGLWITAAVVVGMLLVEVWAGSRVAQLSLTLGHNRTALEKAEARLAFMRADIERRTTRAETAPLAAQLGLAPADAQQVVVLPSSYLTAAVPANRTGNRVRALAWAERVSRALVPEATARVRADN